MLSFIDDENTPPVIVEDESTTVAAIAIGAATTMPSALTDILRGPRCWEEDCMDTVAVAVGRVCSWVGDMVGVGEAESRMVGLRDPNSSPDRREYGRR